MAITLSTAAKNAACDAIVDLVDVGAGTEGDFQFRASTTEVVVIDTAATAFGAASNGVATLAGTPLSGTASGGGTVDNFIVRDQDNGTVFSGSCSGSGGGGDIEFDNAAILSGQTVNLTGFTLTVP